MFRFQAQFLKTIPTHNKHIFVNPPLPQISTFSLGQKACAYYEKSAYYECAYYKWAQYESL